MSLPSLRSKSLGKLPARAVYALNKTLNTSAKKRLSKPQKILPLKKETLEKTTVRKRGRPKKSTNSPVKKDIKVQKRSSLIRKKRKNVVKRKTEKDINSSSEADCSSEGEDESDEKEVENKKTPKEKIKQEVSIKHKSVGAHKVKTAINELENESEGQNSDVSDENVDEQIEDVSNDNEDEEDENETSEKNVANLQKLRKSDLEKRMAFERKSCDKKSFKQNMINAHKNRIESVKERQRYLMQGKIGKKRKISLNGITPNQSVKKKKLEREGYNFNKFMDSPFNDSRSFYRSFPFGPDARLLNKSFSPAVSSPSLNSLETLIKCNKSVSCGNIAASEVFSWLINPISPQYFFKNIFEKTAYHVERQKPNYYKELFCCDDITTILKKNVLQYGVHLDVVKYAKGERIPLQAEGRAYSSNVWEDYEEGYSIRMRNPHTYHKKLSSICSLLQEYFSSTVGVNMYLTPPKAQGFPPHYDDIDAFIAQVEGTKFWRIYKPRKCAEDLARYPSKDFSVDEIDSPFMEVCLKPGDLIYIPRGYIHQAATGGSEHSLHLTFSTNQLNTWGDLLLLASLNALEKAILNNVELRKALPKDFPDHVGVSVKDFNISPERQAFIKKMEELAQMSLTYLDPDGAADIHFANFISKSLPPSLTLMEKKHSLHGSGSCWKNGEIKMKRYITVNTEIQLIRKRDVRLVIDEGGPKLYHNFENPSDPPSDNVEGVCIDFDIEGVPAFNYLLKKFPEFVKVGELPFANMEDKLSFALSLYENGVLMTKKPLCGSNEDFN